MSSNLRSRPSSTAAPAADGDPPPPSPSSPPPSTSGQKILSQALTSTAYLSNLLPTGTLLAFQLLVPVFTHGGACDGGGVTRHLTISLLALLALSCFFASFTDSVTIAGKVYYGVATRKGLWLVDYPDPDGGGLPDLTKKRLRIIDGVHAALSVLVFGVVALRDRNVVSCLYPSPGTAAREVLDIVPVGVGVVCGLLFVAFPTKRHGIGFPVTAASG